MANADNSKPTTITPARVAKAKATAAEQLASYCALAVQLGTLADKFKQAAEPLKAQMEGIKLSLESLSKADLKPEFNGSKILRFPNAEMGFKLGKWALSLPTAPASEDEKKWLEGFNAKLLKAVQKAYPAAVVEVINTPTLIDVWDSTPALSKACLKLGVDVTQKDGFYITPKKEVKKPVKKP